MLGVVLHGGIDIDALGLVQRAGAVADRDDLAPLALQQLGGD